MNTPLPPPVLEEEEEDKAVLSCLDVLQCASAVLARHKGKLSALLSSRGGPRGKLERLMADLAEVLSTGMARTTTAGEGQQQQRGGEEKAVEEGGEAPGQEHRRVKRAKEEEQAAEGSPASCDVLGVAEVVQHVMSFAEYQEVLWGLSRVCRLWRSVSERESLCLPLVEREVPSALLGGAASLHAKLGSSARWCLLVRESWRSGPRPAFGPRAEDLRGLVEVWHGDKLLCAAQGPALCFCEEERGFTLELHGLEDADVRREALSAASLGGEEASADLRDVFSCWHGNVRVRFCVMDGATGVTACLFDHVISQPADVHKWPQGCWNFDRGMEGVDSPTFPDLDLQAVVGKAAAAPNQRQ